MEGSPSSGSRGLSAVVGDETGVPHAEQLLSHCQPALRSVESLSADLRCHLLTAGSRTMDSGSLGSGREVLGTRAPRW